MDVPQKVLMGYLQYYNLFPNKTPPFAGLPANIGYPFLLARGHDDQITNFHHANTLDEARSDGYLYTLSHAPNDYRDNKVWIYQKTEKGYEYKGKVIRQYPSNPKNARDFDTVWITKKGKFYVNINGKVSSKRPTY